MRLEFVKDRLLEVSAICRRIYGLELLIKTGPTDVSKWFLFNCENLKYKIDLQPGGIVLDIGAFKGQYTEKILPRYGDMDFWLYEPIAEYFQICQQRLGDKKSVTVHQSAVSANGRNFEMQVDGLRSRRTVGKLAKSVLISSVDIQDVFDSAQEFELLKMNIEGMEYECLEKLISTNSLIKARYLLIQFHNFESDSAFKLNKIRESLKNNYENLWSYDWMWELWKRKEE